MGFFKKLSFTFNKPPLIIVTGNGRLCAKEAILKVLDSYSKKENIFILESDLKNEKDIEFLRFIIKKSKLPILVGTHIGDIPPDKDFFDGKLRKAAPIKRLAEVMPYYGFLVLNFDDETVREIEEKSICHSITFGFQERSDLKASDINVNVEGINLKINYRGNIIPFWLRNIFGKEQVYSVLAAIAVGLVKNINLVEISGALKNYHSLPGKMRLIEGIKKTKIIDDSENATLFSMIEGLDILKKIGLREQGRKVAVLGDVLGIGKYAIEAHETIGEKAAEACQLLFTVGSRANFIAQGALRKGMKEENIFKFDDVGRAKMELQKQIQKGDLILIDGSNEMKMQDIVKEIRFIN